MKLYKPIPPRDLQRFHLPLENAFDAIFWGGTDANICQVNEAACRHLGYSREELTHLIEAGKIANTN